MNIESKFIISTVNDIKSITLLLGVILILPFSLVGAVCVGAIEVYKTIREGAT
jgi:hypothetical protein